MKTYFKILFISIFIVASFSISFVSASDVNETAPIEVADEQNEIIGEWEDEYYYDDTDDYEDDTEDDYDNNDYYDDDTDDYDDFSVKLNKNHNVKISGYTVKLTSKQYKSLVKDYKKNKPITIKVKTKYNYKIYKPYYKTVKKHKTLKLVKTYYGYYCQQFKKMKRNGWKLQSEKTFTKKNPKNKYGIGLSAYTYSISKWVKKYKKVTYKTKKYPIYAKITIKSNKQPTIKLYSKAGVIDNEYLSIVGY